MAPAGAPIRVPAAVACRVLGLSTQGYYKWLKEPVSHRDWDDAHLIDVLYEAHADDATLGYRFLTDELDTEYGITANNGLAGSMGRSYGAGDNASMESFFSLLQKNVLNTRRWESREELRLAMVTWIETRYNRRRGPTRPRQAHACRV